MSCSGGAREGPPPAVSQDIVDITNLIQKTGSFVLNESPRHSWANLFQGDDRLQLRSDADEQLIIHLAMQECVKLHSITLVAPDPEAAPMCVKLYINRPSFSFGDGDSAATQELDLKPEECARGSRIPLKFVKFQRVHSLTIFIETNHGSDYTAFSSLRLYGTPVQGTNMDNIKKVG